MTINPIIDPFAAAILLATVAGISCGLLCFLTRSEKSGSVGDSEPPVYRQAA
jgi:hypothetical protein